MQRCHAIVITIILLVTPEMVLTYSNPMQMNGEKQTLMRRETKLTRKGMQLNTGNDEGAQDGYVPHPSKDLVSGEALRVSPGKSQGGQEGVAACNVNGVSNPWNNGWKGRDVDDTCSEAGDCASTLPAADQENMDQVKHLMLTNDTWLNAINSATQPKWGTSFFVSGESLRYETIMGPDDNGTEYPDFRYRDRGLQWALACGRLPDNSYRIATLPCSFPSGPIRDLGDYDKRDAGIRWQTPSKCDVCTNTDGNGVSKHYPCVCAASWKNADFSTSPICDVGDDGIGELCNVGTATSSCDTPNQNHTSGPCEKLTASTCPSPRCIVNGNACEVNRPSGPDSCVDDPSRRRSGKTCGSFSNSASWTGMLTGTGRCSADADLTWNDTGICQYPVSNCTYNLSGYYQSAKMGIEAPHTPQWASEHYRAMGLGNDNRRRTIRALVGNSINPLGQKGLEYQEGLTYCCNTCSEAPISINFGGENSIGSNTWGTLERPELPKTEKCNSTGHCSDCAASPDNVTGLPDDDANCWTTIEDADGSKMMIKTNGSEGDSTYSISIYASCHQSQGKWKFRTWKDTPWSIANLGAGMVSKNAKLHIYRNDTLDRTINFFQGNVLDGGTKWKTAKLDFEITAPVGGNTWIRVVMEPVIASESALAKIQIRSMEVDPQVDICMDHKHCLRELGDKKNKAAVALRQKNDVQLCCIRTWTSPDYDWLYVSCFYPSTGMPNPPNQTQLENECTLWLACMDDSTKNDLRTTLEAGAGSLEEVWLGLGANPYSSGSLIEEAQGSNTTMNTPLTPDTPTCVNPAVDDPEAWDCTCLDNVRNCCDNSTSNCDCDGSDCYVGPTDGEPTAANRTACFRKLYCASNEVCQSWKDSNSCSSNLLQLGEGKGRSSHIQTETDTNTDTKFLESQDDKDRQASYKARMEQRAKKELTRDVLDGRESNIELRKREAVNTLDATTFAKTCD